MATGYGWDGTITVSQFRSAAVNLQDRWKRATSDLPQWAWMLCPLSPYASTTPQGDGYLCLENVLFQKEIEENSRAEPCPITEEANGIDGDDVTLVLDASQQTHSYDFHIVYSFTYRVPVLYFRGYRCDGQPLDIDNVEKDIPLHSSEILKQSKWTYITYEEHPHLHRPWLMLHPCATSEWMNLLLGGNKGKQTKIDHYLISWLSVVGQAVGLKVPFEMRNFHLGWKADSEE